MSKHRYMVTTSPEEEIKRLREELYESRTAILDLMPEEARKILMSYYRCQSSEEGFTWKYDTINQIIGLAKVLEPNQGAYFSDRAYCPLCGRGSSAPYEEGFAIPEGLSRHLEGWGTVRQCDVMRATLKLAREYWFEKFHAQDAAEAKRKEIVKRRRESTETVYRIAPHGKPQLIDDLSWDTPRDPLELSWAERRLEDLGFTISMEGNIKSYIKEHDDCVVYADPRAEKEIKFSAFKKPLPKSSRSGVQRGWIGSSFSLRDDWKKDLLVKHECRVAKAIKMRE